MAARRAGIRGSNPTDPSEAEYLSPNAAGRELGITGEAVKQWIYRRKLPARKLSNGYWRILRDDLDRFVKERREGGRRRMLIVGAIADRIAPGIEACGWQPLVAHNPVDAVIRAFDSRPSAVIVDLASLGDDGWIVAEKIRASRGTKGLPILFIAAKGAEADAEAMEKALAVSAQGYLCGDVTAEAILEAAMNVLGA